MKIQFLIFFLLTFFIHSSCKQEQSIRLKIMSYNIHHGEGMDGILDLSRIARIIKSQNPDFCALQEVDNLCSRTDRVDQSAFIGQNTLMKATFGEFMDYQGGEYGMASLTVKPVISSKVLELPDAKEEPRSSIIQEIQITESYNIVFANVHFDWIEGEEGSANRLKQAKALVKYIDSLDKATIITGDFNCTPDSRTMKYFAEQGFIFVKKGEDNLSFQGNSKSEIDHVIYRNSSIIKFEPKNIELLIEPIASDHRPLVAELKIMIN